MREIKFRAWDGKKMFVPQRMAWAMDGDIFTYNEDDDTYLSSRTLMQYTGLKDKRGVEIYEGDILASSGDNYYYPVSFHKGTFGMELPPLGSTHIRHTSVSTNESGESDYYEVIGNIYENPELLEKGS